ncbi:hypothetical protein MACH09_46060 [Vibrio sp. MACH09]|uniref:hypothetical protein n=1 Tax=Vibrio sp. MACH09 TaxID=3025122 RepID=UPI00278FCBF1|nr:hypothetical protein [Vibrio sp. MACH09]GLO64098.1 hypothetical protein MACH09_46060 [Vibrio sp. MACH09]
MNLIQLETGLYLDAFAIDPNNHVQFLSLWGRDGVMQHFFATLTLPIAEGGRKVMTVKTPDGDVVFDFSRIKTLTKRTTRLPKFTPVGEWVHTWLYDDRLLKCEAQQTTLLSRTPLDWDALWPTIKQLCHLPLLEDWKEALHAMLMPYIHALPSWGIYAYHIHLPIEEIESIISNALSCQILTLKNVGGDI